MIKNIFLPEKIGTYYLFSKRIIGIDIGKTHINATQVHVGGNTISIEKCIEENLEAGNPNDHTERLGHALKKIISRVKIIINHSLFYKLIVIRIFVSLICRI